MGFSLVFRSKIRLSYFQRATIAWKWWNIKVFGSIFWSSIEFFDFWNRVFGKNLVFWLFEEFEFLPKRSKKVPVTPRKQLCKLNVERCIRIWIGPKTKLWKRRRVRTKIDPLWGLCTMLMIWKCMFFNVARNSCDKNYQLQEKCATFLSNSTDKWK